MSPSLSKLPLNQQVAVDTCIPGLKHPHRLIFVGRSGKGKTSTIISLLYWPKLFRSFFHRIFVFSPSAKTDPKWLHLQLPQENLYDTVRKVDILKIMEQCIGERNKVIKECIKSKKEGELPRYLVIFDDCGAEQEMRGHLYANPVDTLNFNCRWYGISVWYGIQNLNSLSVPTRTQANGIITWDPETKLQTDVLMQNYGTKDGVEFRKMVKESTVEPHSFMFINRSGAQTIYGKGFNKRIVPPSQRIEKSVTEEAVAEEEPLTKKRKVK